MIFGNQFDYLKLPEYIKSKIVHDRNVIFFFLNNNIMTVVMILNFELFLKNREIY
jgi:hypothetical protein